MSFRPGLRSLVLLCVAAAVASLVLVAGAASEPSRITEKREQAREVLAQIRVIDSELSQAVERYNQASGRLAAIEAELQTTKRHLGVARKASRTAEETLEERVVALYQGGQDSLLEVFFGSATLDELLDRVDAAERLSSQDRRIVDEVAQARSSYRAAARELEEARAEQKRVVADRQARRDEIEAKLDEREALYDSIRDEIERLQAEEERRQARLAAEAEQRLEQSADEQSASPSADGGVIAAAPASPYGGVAGIALGYLGVPYVWGGASPGGFDCSGLVMYVYAQVGVSLPHSTYAQWELGVPVSSGALQAGDIVFFDGLGHNGIYIGGGQFVHAPHTGDVVKISSLGDSWYAATYMGARRIL
ncbi:MAG: NlpC/P60 family protein [Gaiellales bacterium]